MAPIMHCIRHAQGYHNLGAGDYTLRDPLLTPDGEAQCIKLRATHFPDPSTTSLVFASPLCRTLQTAIVLFGSAVEHHADSQLPPIIALPDLQETSDDACDTGSDPSVLHSIVEKFDATIDLSLIEAGWNDKSLASRYGPHADALESRARDARLFIRKKVRDLVTAGDVNAHVAIVSHGGFLHFLTQDWEDAALRPGTGWINCETRSYIFEDDELCSGTDGEARMVETEESRRARGKSGVICGKEVQRELFTLAMEQWGMQGLQRPDTVMVTRAVDEQQATLAVDPQHSFP